jgi:hypothetical protein
VSFGRGLFVLLLFLLPLPFDLISSVFWRRPKVLLPITFLSSLEIMATFVSFLLQTFLKTE